MLKRFTNLFRLNNAYDNLLDERLAAGLFALTWILVAAWAVWLALVAAPALLSGVGLTTLVLPALAGATALILILALLQMRRLSAASWLFVGLLGVLFLPPALDLNATGFSALATPAQLVIPLVAAGLLLDRRGLSIVAMIALAAAGLRAVLEAGAPTSASAEIPALIVLLVSVIVLLLLFGGQARRTLAQLGREQAVLETSAGYVNTVIASRDEADLLLRTVHLIRNDRGYADAKIYLVDEANIRRVIRPGLSGQTAADSATEDDRALVAQVAQKRVAVVTTATSPLSRRLVAPVQAALTLPIAAGGRLLGIVDIHTQRPNFSNGEQTALESLAQQLGAHLAELRVVEDLRRTLLDQEAALGAGLRAATGPLRTSASEHLNGPQRAQQALGFDLTIDKDGARLTPATELSTVLQAALDSPAPYVEADATGQTLFLPVRYRSVLLGAMTFNVPLDQPIGERQLELAKIVADRLGQALENAKLFEQSQSQALREHKASEVSATLISATDVRAVLAIAAETFNEAMGAISTRVTLQPDAAAAPRNERPEGVAP